MNKVKSEKVRMISVKPGDAFGSYGWTHTLVVLSIDGVKAKCSYTSGRRVSVQIRRLQREYPRCGEIETVRARKRLAAVDKREAAR